MKKLFLCFALAIFIATPAYPRKAFAELLGRQKGLFSNMVKVNVDFGQYVSFWKPGDQTIVDENGKDVVFNSMVDAMNFMGERGWEFVQAYVVSEGSQLVYHWLMTKDVNSDEEIKQGFNVRADMKEVDKPQYILTYLKKKKSDTQWDVIDTETKRLTPDELNSIRDEWVSKSNDKYDYDLQIKKD